MAVAVLIMAQQRMPINGYDNGVKQQQERDLLNPVLHDFLGMKYSDSQAVLGAKTASFRNSEASPSASVSLGASSGGGRGPISTTSDLGSERQGGNHLEGVPFYGARSDISGPEISNRLIGTKRSSSDSTFMGSSKDGTSHMGPDFPESSQLMKIFRNGAGGDRPRRSYDDEVVFGTQQSRPTSASLLYQPLSGVRIDSNVTKWDQSIPMSMGLAAHYPTQGGHPVPLVRQQVPCNKFGDANVRPSNISQSAADEGSRTGIKGLGIWSSINANGGSDKSSFGLLPSCSRQKSGAIVSEPESSTSPCQHGFVSASSQMTIFYGGQAHVFDDVHPNKADVIMALAGSNGASWSTTYSPKSTTRPAGESHKATGEVETGKASSIAFLREYRGRSVPSTSNQGVSLGDQISIPAGGPQVSAKDMRNLVQGTEPIPKEKTEP